MKNWNAAELLLQAVQQDCELRLFIGYLVGMDHPDFGSLVQGAEVILHDFTGFGGISFLDGSTEFLFHGLQSSPSGLIPDLIFLAGAQSFQR